MRCDEPESCSSEFAAVLAEYLTRIDQGQAVCREAFIAEHPQHQAALWEYFRDVDLLAGLAASGPATAEDEPLPVEFGDYVLLEEIGRGGMGVVYRAREQATGQVVALKRLIHGRLASSAEAVRFRNEARTAAALRHPGILAIYDVGQCQGRLYYTMPCVEGSSLARRLAQGPLDPAMAARLLRSVAEAVAYAHARGVVHRDLKPGNVLVDEQDRAYVADFGLARTLGDERTGVTASSDLLGTPNYMAPEQISGGHSLVGPSADVYAMGAMLYALVVGRPPFHSRSPTATLHKIATTEPTPPRRLRPDVPPALETICLKCLEKSPAHRYRSAADLADDLQRFLAGQAPRARRPSRLERSRRWFVRNPAIGMLAVAVALVALAGAAVSWHYAAAARQGQQEAAAGLYAADMNLAQQHLRTGAVASALELLERHQAPPGAASSADWEWQRLWRQCHGELRRFEGPQSDVYAAAFSPDGRLAAAGGAERVLWIWDVATGKTLHRIAGHAGAIQDVAFTPDGRRLVSVGDETLVRVWDVTTGEPVAALEGHAQSLTAVSASGDGRFIATGGAHEPCINIWDAAALKLRQSLDAGPAERLTFAPRDYRLAVAGRDGRLRILARAGDDWSLAATIDAHADVVRDVAWSPDGSRLATGAADHLAKLWDGATGDELAAIGVAQESVYGLAFRPDGRRLALSARNEPLRVWDCDQGKIVAELGGDAGLVSSVAYCPQGWRLLTASEDGSVRLWDAERTTAHDELRGHQSRVRSIDVAPDGRTLASQDADSASVVLWDVATAQPRRVLHALPTAPTAVAFNRSGRLLATAVDSRLCIWDVTAGKLVHGLEMAARPLAGVAWHPRRDVLATQAQDGTMHIVDAASGKVVARWAAAEPSSPRLGYSPDGSCLVVGSRSGGVEVWRVATQTLVHELQGHTAPIVDMTFNRQGTMIASSSNDHTIRLWDAATGRPVRTLVGHAGTPCGIAFSPDGSRLASGGTDRLVKIWDVARGLELQSLGGHADWVLDVAFTPDGQTLITSSGDSTVRLWRAGRPAPPETASREAAALVAYLARRSTARQLAPGDLEAVMDEVAAAINQDTGISEEVRAASLGLADGYLYHWPPMCDGHAAAERGDWAGAVAAFQRAAALAPEDLTLWNWLALASLGAGDEAEHERACDELLDRVAEDAGEVKLRLVLEACLLTPGDERRHARLAPLLKKYQEHDRRWLNWPAMFELRTGQTPTKIREFSESATTQQARPEYSFAAALAWAKTGDLARAKAAYEIGVRHARSLPPTHWIGKLISQTLEREARHAVGQGREADGP
ncbi:MAG: hypothetical protein DCC67_00705 [Planctomycetota bacterium]|nr:MAG: hypothetical protein DCC67_00705 [Planctomycetota bacterium]